MPRKRSNTAKALALGLLSAILITIGCMLLLAASLVVLQFSDTLLRLFNQIIKLLSIALGVCVAVPRGGERGFASGVLIALVYIAVGNALYVALGGGGFSAAGMLGDMLLGSAAGAATGAIRANLSARARSAKA